MNHPFTDSRTKLGIYFGFWTLYALVYCIFLHQFFQASWSLAIVDAFIYNLWFSLLGLGLWYAVRFSKVEKHNPISLVMNHAGAAMLAILLWLSLGYYSMLSMFFIDTTLHPDFFESTMTWRVIAGLSQYVFIVLIYYVIMYYSNFQDRLVREAQLKSSIQKSELNVLRSQINPHFLFNSLNSIAALSLAAPQKARDMTLSLSDFLRYSLQQKDSKLISLGEEMENIRRYLAIERIRYGDKMKWSEDLGEDCLNKEVPVMILQPLIENAIKHGVSESTGLVEIEVKACWFQGFMKIQISNGYEQTYVKPKGSNTGLKNIMERMELMYGRTDLVQIQKNHQVFCVTLSFPFTKI
ncbi:MAG: sensor histidine kinase [Cyclobacteriaceae bacterium]